MTSSVRANVLDTETASRLLREYAERTVRRISPREGATIHDLCTWGGNPYPHQSGWVRRQWAIGCAGVSTAEGFIPVGPGEIGVTINGHYAIYPLEVLT